MHIQDQNTRKIKLQPIAGLGAKKMSGNNVTFVDNRPEAAVQRKVQQMVNVSPQVAKLSAFQKMADKKRMLQKNFTSETDPVQRVPVSNSNMNSLFPGGKKGNEWFFWGKGGYHVGAIRESDGTGEVSEFHVKKEFKGSKTNRIDWIAAAETYNEVVPPTKLEHDQPEVLESMRDLGEETKDLLIKWKKDD